MPLNLSSVSKLSLGPSPSALLVKGIFGVSGMRLDLVTSLLFVSSLIAQQPPESDPGALLQADGQRRTEWASKWLHSDDPLRVAWGAWLAQHDHEKSLCPLLIEKAVAYQPVDASAFYQPQERDRHDALLVVLDALIELDAAVPVTETRKLYPEFPAQSLILLVRSQEDSTSALLDIAANAKANWNWLAAGNALAKSRAAGFAALLLSRFTQHMTVSVVSPGYAPGYNMGWGSECSFSLAAPKTGWPAVGLYWLTQFPERFHGLKATFLVDGQTPVYYWRKELGNYDNPPDLPGYCDDGNRDRYRAEYLKKLTQFAYPAIFVDPYPQVSITWKDDADYRNQLIAAVEKQRVVLQRIVARLQQSGKMLTPNETATLKSRLEIVIRDERVDRSTALPTVLENDAMIAIRTAFTKPLD
jgi:hypothetical protein